MTIKVSDLEGVQLDYWVARAIEAAQMADEWATLTAPSRPDLDDPHYGRLYWAVLGRSSAATECVVHVIFSEGYVMNDKGRTVQALGNRRCSPVDA